MITHMPSTYLTLSDDLRSIALEITGNTIHKARRSDFMPNNGMAKFAKAICKELKRPYIPYFKWATNDKIKGISIEIPNKQFMRPITAPLMIVSKDVANIFWAHRFTPEAPDVSHSEIMSYTTYYFNGVQGMEIFNNWLARTQEDPDMRRALKLPPK